MFFNSYTENPQTVQFNITPAIEFFEFTVLNLNPHTRVWSFSSANKNDFIAGLLNSMLDNTDLTEAFRSSIIMLAGMGVTQEQAAGLCHTFAMHVLTCLTATHPNVTITDLTLYKVGSFRFDMLTLEKKFTTNTVNYYQF